MARRLAAILSLDVVEYSRHMGLDEAGTLAAVKAHHKQLFEPKVDQYSGRIVKLIGDGALLEFPSAVDAVSFAVEAQCAMRARNEGVPQDRQILYRIGINIGDILIEDDDIFGDGVNIAARLEGLAEPGGICVARNVVNQVKGKLDLAFEALGRRKVKNIGQPVPVYQVVLDDQARQLVTEVPKAASTRNGWQPFLAAVLVLLVISAGVIWWQPWASSIKPAPLEIPPFKKTSALVPDKPSIAVLPFINMSNDSEQEYFSDGMTEDLITDLSRISGLTVISRTSTFAYKNRVGDVRTIGRELGTRYVVQGSVRSSGGRVRISVQLIDAHTGGHLWAERYDREMGEIFALQDDVIEKIFSALAVKITDREKNYRARTDHDTTPETHDIYLRGSEALHRFTPEGIEVARSYFLKAIAMDPTYARAYAALGFTYSVSVILARTDDPERLIEQSLKYAQKAIELDDTLPQGYFSIAIAHIRRGRHMDAIKAARRAIKYDPNYADGYAVLANSLAYSGKGAEAKVEIQNAMKLNPRYSAPYIEVLGRAHFVLEEYDAAIKLFRNCVSRDPTSLQCRLMLASAYGLTGAIEEAEWEVEEVRNLTPDFSLQRRYMTSQFLRDEDKKRYISGLRKAGAPAGN